MKTLWTTFIFLVIQAKKENMKFQKMKMRRKFETPRGSFFIFKFFEQQEYIEI